MDNLVLAEVLIQEPLHSGVAFVGEVGNNSCLVKALVYIDLTVEQINLDAGFLSLLENIVPTGRLSCGDEQVINTLGDETLSRLKLLVVLDAVERLEVVAVIFRENCLHVLHVGFTITGLRRRVINNADLDQFVLFILAACGQQTGKNKQTHK